MRWLVLNWRMPTRRIRPSQPGELVLEPAAVDLVVVVRREVRRPELDAPRQVGVVTGGLEEAQTVLLQMGLVQVLLHAQHLGEVVRARRDRRLTHLERRL